MRDTLDAPTTLITSPRLTTSRRSIPIYLGTPFFYVDGVSQSTPFPRELKRQIQALEKSLLALLRDPEQEVIGSAAQLLDAVIENARRLFPENPVIVSLIGPIESELIFAESMRAAEALLITQQIDAIIGPWPPAIG